MASKKAWFQKGEAGRKQAESEDAAAEARRKARSGPQRFYLKNDTSAKSTFLDNPDFFLHEHNLKINGKFYNYFTCLKDIDTCPICDDGDQPSYIVVATIIDHRKFTKEGKEYVNEKKLIVFKGRARQRIMKQIERRDGDLKFCAYELSRGSTGTECSTGEDFEFLKRLTREQVISLAPKGTTAEDWLKPLNYEEIFAPKTAAELRKILGGEVPVGAGEEGDGFPEGIGGEGEGNGGEPEEKSEKKEKDKEKEKPKEQPKVESIDDLL